MLEQKSWYWLNGTRYYRINLQKDIFGGWHLVKSWGSTNSHRGGMQIESYNTVQELDLAIVEVFKRRRDRGYSLKSN